jgi:hypothetical protein
MCKEFLTVKNSGHYAFEIPRQEDMSDLARQAGRFAIANVIIYIQHNGAPAVRPNAPLLLPASGRRAGWISPKAETYLLRMVCQII